MKRGLRRDKGNFSTACETSEKRELSRGKICNLQWLRLPHRQVRLPAHTVRVSVCACVCGSPTSSTNKVQDATALDGRMGCIGWVGHIAALP